VKYSIQLKNPGLFGAFSSVSQPPVYSPLLVGTHEPAVTRHIRGENGGQLAFDASRGQKRRSQNRMGRRDYRL
jgi:hypothetical protein